MFNEIKVSFKIITTQVSYFPMFDCTTSLSFSSVSFVSFDTVTVFVLLLLPRSKLKSDFLIPSNFDKNEISSVLASPSTGGAAIFTSKPSSVNPVIPFSLLPGFARTLMARSPFLSMLMAFGCVTSLIKSFLLAFVDFGAI